MKALLFGLIRGSALSAIFEHLRKPQPRLNQRTQLGNIRLRIYSNPQLPQFYYSRGRNDPIFFPAIKRPQATSEQTGYLATANVRHRHSVPHYVMEAAA